MKATDTISTIILLFRDLSKDEQVEVMTDLYYDMTDSQKDKFLEETENS